MTDSSLSNAGQVSAEIEVTPEMIEVGADMLLDRASDTMTLGGARDLARDLFKTICGMAGVRCKDQC